MGVVVRRSHSRALSFIGLTPGSASLHPGLYAAARIRELRVFSPGLRPDLCTFARIRELRTLGFMLPFAFAS